MNDLLLALNKPYIQGITFSGGHPLEDYNLASIYNIIKTIKTKYPDKDIWLYTGYTLNISHFTTIRNPISRHDFDSNLMHDILLLCDVVVDGPYVQELRDISLLYRGSRNQRLIDVKQTLAKGEIQLWSRP
jgi:anaerobic ribonucleoside-triphosphate reductase activating protein